MEGLGIWILMLVQEDFGAWDDAQQTDSHRPGWYHSHFIFEKSENWECHLTRVTMLARCSARFRLNSLWLPNTFYFQSCLSTGSWGITLTDTGTCRTGRNFMSWTLKTWEESSFITVVTFHDVITWITSSSEMQNLWWHGSAFLRILQFYRFLLHMWLCERDGERKHGCVHVWLHNHRMD